MHILTSIDVSDHAARLAFTGADTGTCGLPDLGRTEDCRFSPDGRLLLVAGYAAQSIAVFRVAGTGPGKLHLDGMAWLSHPRMNHPHGVDFIDARTIAIANRKGRLSVHSLPDTAFDGRRHTAPMRANIRRAARGEPMKTPGSIAVIGRGPGRYDLLACLNYRHAMTLQSMQHRFGLHIRRGGRIVLEAGLAIPDGVSVCRATGRVAISNHNEHAVRLYPSADSLTPEAEPCGRLTGAGYPHGLRFFDNGRALMVADAGAPLVHLYRDPEARWQGERAPLASFRVMDEATFAAGHYNPQEGGPKGIDIDPSEHLMLVTSEHQQLAAFDLAALRRLAEGRGAPTSGAAG